MNKHALIPLIIGLVVGIVALKLGYDYVNKMKKQGGPNLGPTQKLVVAGKDLPLGTKITEKDVVVTSWIAKSVPEGTFVDAKDVIGQTLKTSLPAKLPILKNNVGPGIGLEGTIPSGFRAVAVKVDEFTSVGGLLKPGVKVDVLATFNMRKSAGKSETISKLVLQNIEVRAVGQQFQPDNSGIAEAKTKISQSVTLLVKSDQAEILQLAASTGSIRLALRSASDLKPETTKGVTLSQLIPGDGTPGEMANKNTFKDLLAMAGRRSAPSNQHEPYEVEIIHGSQSDRIYFASSQSDKRVEPSKDENKGSELLTGVQVE